GEGTYERGGKDSSGEDPLRADATTKARRKRQRPGPDQISHARLWARLAPGRGQALANPRVLAIELGRLLEARPRLVHPSLPGEQVGQHHQRIDVVGERP